MIGYLDDVAVDFLELVTANRGNLHAGRVLSDDSEPHFGGPFAVGMEGVQQALIQCVLCGAVG
jgi:hypothetical protein